MFISKNAFTRTRTSLLATSMFATTALAGFGGVVGSVVLTPGAAFAQTCTPDPQNAPPASASVGNGATEICVGNYTTGIGFGENQVGGNLSVRSMVPGWSAAAVFCSMRSAAAPRPT
jgi:hypothetical protein